MSAVTLAARVVPLRLRDAPPLRLVHRNLVAARHYWLVLFSGFFEPVFYLVGLGIGVGALVGDLDLGGRVVSYQEFVAPALLAASAMNGAIYETTGNVFFKLRYARTYDGVLATPLGIRDIALAELTFALMRGAVYSLAFVLVMVALGLAASPWVVLAAPAALLVGGAFAGLGLAAVSVMRSWADFGFVEVATLPMFLFSATFVPLAEYPQAAQWILPLTPLYHGVELLRSLTLGDVGFGILAHVAYLVALTVAGLAFAARRLERQLLK